MPNEIICPYCFETFQDDHVLFRSEKVLKKSDDILPENYNDIEEVKNRYNGSDKQVILDDYFFMETEDSVYENFWKRFNGTTENKSQDEYFGIHDYERRLLNPSLVEHQQYLKLQGEDYFIRDYDGMVIQIELKSGERCTRRVCPHCHNPLPDNYGKHAVKFTSIIGATTSGKTIYISQLLKKMKFNVSKVGLNAVINNSEVRSFIEKNRVKVNHPVPNSTEDKKFQQPLFYEMIRENGEGHRITETFVLYDVAGEVFKDRTSVQNYAPFIGHSDGIIFLIDPMQFEVIHDISIDEEDQDIVEPSHVLDAIHTIISDSKKDKKSDVPIAVCISKSDLRTFQDALDEELRSLLKEEVVPITDENGYSKTIFNAQAYNPIFKSLKDFIIRNGEDLAITMRNNYENYAYFAFTALGCDVVEGIAENGNKFRSPQGPVLPKRIEEPLLWLFYKFGYISTNEKMYNPSKEIIHCQNCGGTDVEDFERIEKMIKLGGKNFLGREKKKKMEVNHRCNTCDHEWLM